MTEESLREIAALAVDATNSFNEEVLYESYTTNFFYLFGGTMVFFMQAGFAMLTAGCVRSKNVKNVLVKNLLDACIGSIMWFSTGFAIAYSDKTNNDYGHWFLTSDAFNDLDNTSAARYADFFFQWAFAATAATIVCGGVAERCSFKGYICYSALLTAFIYPTVVRMTWGGGYLSQEGYSDYAGSGIVHMTGGIASLCGSIIIGPRIGRFLPDGSVNEIPGHNAALTMLGTMILWFGWYGFNPVSELSIAGGGIYNATRVAVITTIGAGAGATSNLFLNSALSGFKELDMGMACNGALAGLVAITAGPNVFTPMAAMVVGALSCFVYTGASKGLKMLKIDDPLDAFAVHGATGFWGVVAVGLFAVDSGAFYGNGGSQLGKQLLGAGVITAFVGACSVTMFLAIKYIPFIGLRVSAEEEEAGMDVSKHGGHAYPEIAK